MTVSLRTIEIRVTSQCSDMTDNIEERFGLSDTSVSSIKIVERETSIGGQKLNIVGNHFIENQSSSVQQFSYLYCAYWRNVGKTWNEMLEFLDKSEIVFVGVNKDSMEILPFLIAKSQIKCNNKWHWNFETFVSGNFEIQNPGRVYLGVWQNLSIYFTYLCYTATTTLLR